MFDAMQGPFVALLILAFPASLFVAARLWRIGRLSDRAVTNLVVGIVPVLIFAFGVIQGSSVPFILGTTALVLLPGLALYRTVFDLIREQRLVGK